MTFEMFDCKDANFDKLAAYGFEERDGGFLYVTNIADGQFEMSVLVSDDGNVKTEVIDLASGEPYSLHLVDDATGAFVGAVRADFKRVLSDIADKCFASRALKSDAVQKVLDYAQSKYGDAPEFLWEKFPKDAVLRRKDSNKWYALLVELKRAKLFEDGDGECRIIVMRACHENVAALPDGRRFLPAYHMNKKNWLTAVLDDAADFDKIFALLNESYELAKR